MDAIYDLAQVFPDMEEIEVKPLTDADVQLVLGNPQAGCDFPGCGRPYAALWIAARAWRCQMHPPSDEIYRRRR